MTPARELAQAQQALATIAEAMSDLRAVKSVAYAKMKAKVAEVEIGAEKARSLFADSRRLQEVCDAAGIEVTAVLRRANKEGLI